eukprot:10480911-Lingulodinium_polyedra.AAC.1
MCARAFQHARVQVRISVPRRQRLRGRGSARAPTHSVESAACLVSDSLECGGARVLSTRVMSPTDAR